MPPERSEPREEERPEREGDGRTEPDVLLDVPVLNVEELDLEVEDLRARISYGAELADMVKINVGVEAEVGKAKINIRGIEVQAQLKARLDTVRAIFGEVLATLQTNPELARDMLRATGTDAGSETRAAPTRAEGTAGGVPRTRRTSDEDEPATGGAVDGAAGRKGSLADLPIEEEYVDEQGRLVGRARDESGQVVEAILDEKGNVPKDPSPSTGNGADATDAARLRADELGLKLSGVRGTGAGGRILVRDVEEAGGDGA